MSTPADSLNSNTSQSEDIVIGRSGSPMASEFLQEYRSRSISPSPKQSIVFNRDSDAGNVYLSLIVAIKMLCLYRHISWFIVFALKCRIFSSWLLQIIQLNCSKWCDFKLPNTYSVWWYQWLAVRMYILDTGTVCSSQIRLIAFYLNFLGNRLSFLILKDFSHMYNGTVVKI